MKNKLKLHFWISHLIMIAGFVLAVVGMILRQPGEGVHFLVWVAVVLVFGSVFYKSMTLKCPYCDAFLPAKYKLPEKCPACEAYILEENSDEETDA